MCKYSWLIVQAPILWEDILYLVQQLVFLLLELCYATLHYCIQRWLARLEPGLHYHWATFLDSELLLQLLKYLVNRHKLLTQAIFDRCSSLQVLDYCGQALVEFTNRGEWLCFFDAFRQFSIDVPQLDVLCRPDPVDCLIWDEYKTMVDDVYPVGDVFCCWNFGRLGVHGDWGL